MRAARRAPSLFLVATVLAGCALGGRTITPSFPESFPEFPWPPPRASTQVTLPAETFRGSPERLVLLRDVDRRLSAALRHAGYDERSYHAVPDGFSLTARLEQINSDGTPKRGIDRWAMDPGPLHEFSLSSYLSALLRSRPGLFRVIVFIVTPHPFSQSPQRIPREDAMAWLQDGFNRLPESVGRLVYTDEYHCTALVYEFEKKTGQANASMVWPGRLVARTHLERAAIMSNLRN
jgi:hypothetical protein